jgi:hypothetical protein
MMALLQCAYHLATDPIPDRIKLCRAANVDKQLTPCLLGGLDHKPAMRRQSIMRSVSSHKYRAGGDLHAMR